MGYYDDSKIQNMYQIITEKTGQPEWLVGIILCYGIERSWEIAEQDLELKILWEKYFPKGKPTPEEYLLWLAQAQESGEDIPFLLRE